MSKPAFFIFLAVIYILAWLIQNSLFLSWDVNFMLTATARMLAGGTYTNDFFNPNPPIIFFLYAPVVKLQTLADITLLFRIYIFLIASFILAISYLLARPILKAKTNFFILLMAACFLLLPLYEFGQREHLIIMLIFPYLLLIINRLNKTSGQLSLMLVLISAIIAGIGFAIKPQYVLAFALVEIYYLIKTRSLTALLKPESWIITAIILGHIAFTYIYFPDYFSVIMPHVLRLYYPATSAEYSTLLLNPYSCAFMLTVIYYLTFNTNNKFVNAKKILTIAIISFYLAFFAQRSVFYYHFIPYLTLIPALLYFLYISEDNSLNISTKLRVVNLAVILIPIIIVMYAIINLYCKQLDKKEALVPLVAFMKKNMANDTVMFLNNHVSIPYMAMHDNNNTPGQRFDCLWMTAGLTTMPASQQSDSDTQFLLQMVTEDIERYLPTYIFVDKQKINDINFDYLSFFKQSRHFQKVWLPYQYQTTISAENLYSFAVYKRIIAQ